MLEEYGLVKNVWLGTLLKVSKKWALVYGCDVFNKLCAQVIKIVTKDAISEEVYTVAMRVLVNGLEEVEHATRLTHNDTVKNSKSTKTDASQSDEVHVEETLTITQGIERGHPLGTRVKSELGLSQKREKKSNTTCTDLSNSNTRKHLTSPHQNEVLSNCDTMPTEATCSEKDLHSSINEENAILNPTLNAPTYPSQIVQ
ncbi:hypothetical protein GIB67_014201 [Kingdonia uniflora]|uniref:Uncharacterized protein n=1 Tax=Kingdonia uniflora TaxID=39325 RepID=A0A7J7M1Z7_9MAGN|nr:hypothetical protein GIB67_014201 [Kingdonia uniflora]